MTVHPGTKPEENGQRKKKKIGLNSEERKQKQFISKQSEIKKKNIQRETVSWFISTCVILDIHWLLVSE